MRKNCNTTESISGGTVTYSKGGTAGSEVTYHCKDGFKPYPVFKKVCSSKGLWEPKTSRMKCEGEANTEHTTLTFTFHHLVRVITVDGFYFCLNMLTVAFYFFLFQKTLLSFLLIFLCKKTLIHAFITSRLEYCNIVLFGK